MSVNFKPNSRTVRVIGQDDRLGLSKGFNGLMDDPELSQMFDMVVGLADVAFDRHMWVVAEQLETVLDGILKFKDQRNRGVTGFYSRRKSALPLGTSDSLRMQFQEEISRRAVSQVCGTQKSVR